MIRKALRPAEPLSWSVIDAVLLVLIVCATGLLMWFFHDRFWWPPDGGVYAYSAQRLLDGAVMHVDVQDIHPGYVHWIHALALWLFGEDMVVLRYPLALLTVLQAAIGYILLRPHDRALACAGAAILASLSFVQFINPSANWYALFFTIVAAAVLALIPRHRQSRLFWLGAVIGILFLIRQPNGIFIASAAMIYLFIEETGRDAGREKAWPPRIILSAIALGLAYYLVGHSRPDGALLFGIWPLAVTIGVWRHARIRPARLLHIIGLLTAGAMVAALPLILYHLWYGSLPAWLYDVFVLPSRFLELGFFQKNGYLLMIVPFFYYGVDFASAASALFWSLLLLSGTMLGLRLTAVTWRWQSNALTPVAVIAIFHGLVALHYEIPLYLTFAIPLILFALLQQAPAGRAKFAALVMAGFLCTVGVIWHAGQPLSRGLIGTAIGERIALPVRGPEGASIMMERNDKRSYERLLYFIDQYAPPGAPILGLPIAPEVYFISGRTPPVPFFASFHGITDEEQLEAALSNIRQNPPAVVFQRTPSLSNTPLTESLLDALREDYEYVGRIDPFDLYLPRKPKGPRSGPR